jgi:hypothetical protein
LAFEGVENCTFGLIIPEAWGAAVAQTSTLVVAVWVATQVWTWVVVSVQVEVLI